MSATAVDACSPAIAVRIPRDGYTSTGQAEKRIEI